MDDIKVGTVYIHLDIDGNTIYSNFVSAIEIRDEAILAPYKNGADTVELIDHADTVLAKWFNKVNSVELVDQHLYRIDRDFKHVSIWPNGNPKSIVVTYSYKKLKNEKVPT